MSNPNIYTDFLDEDLSNLKLKVVTCFIVYDKKIILLQRARKDGQHKLWGIPGGKIEIDEEPETCLKRELFEELKLKTSEKQFIFLEKAICENKDDGKYLLYLYYLKLNNKINISLDYSEHYAYKWVSFEEFGFNKLLTCQGLAFELVKQKLEKLIYTTCI